MRKKFTMLLAALLACAGVMKADVTDLPVLTTSTDDIKWYAIKNTRSGKYASYAGDGVQMTQEEAISVNSLFYFTAVDGEVADGFTAVKIHALMTENLLSNYNSWTAEGVTWYLHEDTYSKEGDVVTPAGLHFVKEANLEGWNALNDAGQTKITDYYSQDEGSIFVVESVQLPNLVDAYKEAAKTELETLAQGTDIYPAATTAIEEVEDVALVNTTPSEVIAAAEAVDAIVATYKTNAYKALEGKYFTLYTPGRSGYAKMTVSGTGNAGTASTPDFIWQFVENNGSVNIYNPYIGKYLVMNGTNAMNVTANQAEAGAFDITVASSPSDEDAKIGFKSNGWYIHLNGSLLGWYAGGASEWTVAEVADFTTMVEAYKLSSITALDSWSTLSVVFDAGLINTAKENINAIETTDWATFAAIDAELKNVTDAVAAKMFTFQTTATDDKRNGVWVSANMSTNKAIGADNKDYNAIWGLRHAGGTSFYMFNELNQVYMGAPSSNCPLTAEPVVAYSFEIVDADNNIVEMKCNEETMHASNHDDNKLLNYDYDEAASRWYINTVNATITDEIRTALAELAAVTVPAFNFAAGVNNYDATTRPALDAAVANRTAVLSNLESTTEDLVSAKQQLVDAIAGVEINMPENGKFYRVRCAGNGMKYLQSTLDESDANDVRLKVLSSATSVDVTFCYIDGALLSYTTGLYINAYRFNGVGTKSEVAFSEASNGKVGAYNILVNGRYIFGASDNNKIDSGTTPDARDGYTWWLEEVTTLPVTVSAAGYATLYAPVALTIPAEDVTVYTATVEGEYLTLNELEGTIPAETGVLIEAAEGTYDFAVADDVDAIVGNAFTGALAKSAKNADKKVYTLQKPAEKEVGFYLFKGQNSEGATTYINGFRAWVELDPETPVQALRITRGGTEDTTGIEQLINANGELVIYDLAGRRVEKMEKGIYIVNGKKVIR